MKVPQWRPQKHPQTINEIPFHFGPALIHSLFHFSGGVRKTHTWRGYEDRSTLHSSLQTSLSNSSAVRGRHSSAQTSHFLALHCLIPFALKTLSTVDIETSGQFVSRNSRRLIVRFLRAARTSCMLARPLSFSSVPEPGRLSWFPRSCTLVRKFLKVLYWFRTILAAVEITTYAENNPIIIPFP